MTTLSPLLERLHQALELRGRSAYWLQRRLHAQGVLGSSTGSVSRYMRGEITPPLEFLQAAARVLDVFEPWLISGYGSPDQRSGAEPDPNALEMARKAGKLADEWAEEDRNIDYRIADRCWWYRGLRESTREVVRDLFLRSAGYTLAYRYCPVPWDPMQTASGADLGLARELGSILSAPLRMLGLDGAERPVELSDDQLNDYVLSLCTAISRLLPPRKELSADDAAEIKKWSQLRRESVARYGEKQRRRQRRKSKKAQERDPERSVATS